MIALLTARNDMQPVPRVEVKLLERETVDGGSAGSAGDTTLDGGGVGGAPTTTDGGSAGMTVVEVPDATDRVTLWRIEGGRRVEVRSVIDVPFSGPGFGQIDREPGRGTASSYELQCFANGAEIATVGLGAVSMPAPAPQWATVIQQPLNPGLSVVVEEFKSNVPSVTRSAPADLVALEAGAYPRLVGFGPRGGLTDVAVDFVVPTREAAAAVWATLGDERNPQLPAWVIRSMHPLLPRVFFCEVRGLSETGLDLDFGGTQSRFTATVTEIAPPAPALSVPSLRYTDLAAVFGTYSAIAAAIPRYSDWATAWEYSGAAG